MKTILISLFLLLANFTFAEENSVKKLNSAYKNIKDASGSFIQTSYIKDFDKTQKFKGKFYIKDNKIRWQYEGEFSQVIYLKGETLIVYDKNKKQAIQSSFSEEKFGQLPLALLSRMADIEREFEITEKKPNVVILIPKTKMGNIKRIELIIHDEEFPIKSLKITDSLANTVKIEFHSVRINNNLQDSIFKFVPSKDDTLLKYQ
ncbi:MAG: outer membrane lipoprotein carrier protein LolA [Thermodesulfovibrio sp.]|nr:outer membrane lipoprotein carrier protein LolA [Thermodesulfovibrio sp.]MDW7998928.1 outer membrane lipoprotein carrier protein LolA [Thermodesulfovibrio sp.]